MASISISERFTDRVRDPICEEESVVLKRIRRIWDYLDSVSNVAALSPAERDDYEYALKYVRDYNAQMTTAKNKAMAEGRAEGRAEGALEKLREMVRGLRANGFDDITIAGFIGESPETIANL